LSRRVLALACLLQAGTPLAAPPSEFKDCKDCPAMVRIPAGRFDMGSPAEEDGRRPDEGPMHRVVLRHVFALGKTEVTVKEFRVFAEATGYVTDAEKAGSCLTFVHHDEWQEAPGANWRSPGFPQTDTHPATCISWNDARAYAAWLARRTGKRYRLPTESELEYVARAGSSGPWAWPGAAQASCLHANIADASVKPRFPTWTGVPCDDGALFTSPVASYLPNAFGLHDVIGNVYEWASDCYRERYDLGLPKGECATYARRGGSWLIHQLNARPARRAWGTPTARSDGQGLRVARSLP